MSISSNFRLNTSVPINKQRNKDAKDQTPHFAGIVSGLILLRYLEGRFFVKVRHLLFNIFIGRQSLLCGIKSIRDELVSEILLTLQLLFL